MALLGGIAFVALLLLITYLGKQLRTIEEELIHRAAETTFGIDIAEGQIVYVPIYSFIETDTGKNHPLYSILGIRNSDPERSIIITSAGFYDGRGNLVKQYLDESLELWLHSSPGPSLCIKETSVPAARQRISSSHGKPMHPFMNLS